MTSETTWGPVPCPVIITGLDGDAVGRDKVVAILEKRLKDAENEMHRQVMVSMFGEPTGEPYIAPKLPFWQRVKHAFRWRWYSVREWLAVKVLRVDIHQDWED